MPAVRNPRAEATALVEDGYEARVLEPSPPAVTSEPFADDPPARGDVGPDSRVVSPVATGDLTWEQWLEGHPEHREWVSARWLAAHPRLGPAPEGLARTRDRLHTLLTHVMAPARYRETGRIAARWTLGGFGTPFFGDDVQVRVEGVELVVQRGRAVESAPLTTVGAACRLVLGSEQPDLQWVDDLDLHDPPARATSDAPLQVDPDHTRYLADWFGFAYAVLEQLRADDASTDASRPQLWPEHFDPAIEVLPDRRRASYGFSPGDSAIDEPYAYVSVWYPDDAVADPDDPSWNADGFTGSVLRVSELADVTDQVGFTLDWLRHRRDLLAG